MRPFPGDDGYAGRSRSSSDNDMTPLPGRNQPPQMTYFFTDEKSMEKAAPPICPIVPKQREPKDSTYGVESVDTTITSLSPDNEDAEEHVRNARHNWKKNLGQQMSRKSEEDLESVGSPSATSAISFGDPSRDSSPSNHRRSSQASISRPYTPLSFGSPAPRSVVGTLASRRNSNAGSYVDDVESQAIMSSGDEEEDEARLTDSGSAPQLVMPSIKMPSRRPFTENGKHMGRLKILVAGDSGIGKSSLIKAIVQTCEDIVHVDPLSATSVSVSEGRRKSRTKSRSGSLDLLSTSQISEVYASTRSYPSWWSDLDESRVLMRRRKSMGDSVLERNICFVDTPGYGNKTSCLESIATVMEYVESQFKKATSLEGMDESDIINLLGGNGGSQVDLVLYLIHDRLKPVDIEYLRQLCHLTSVVPVIAQADSIPVEGLSSLKESIRSELHMADIHTFSFASNPSSSTETFMPPFAISTKPSRDLEAMDASLLMSPDYVQPLAPSELAHLVSQIFERDSIAFLRHSAAKKFIQWRAASTPVSRPQGLYRPLTSGSSILPVRGVAPSIDMTNNYALARIKDHTQREERMAQVRLANWAADLQRSLQKERESFETLARSERAVWLTERLGECVQDGTIVPISQARQPGANFDPDVHALVKQGKYPGRSKAQAMSTSISVDPRDPLGLLQLDRQLRRKAWVLMKVMSGFGMLGGFAYWLVKGFQGQDTVIWGMGGLTIRDMIDFGVLDWTSSMEA